MINYELYHYGIKGMKWGIRRYQNKDGSLTPYGKKKKQKKEFKQDLKSYEKARGIIDFEYSNTGQIRNVRARTSDILSDAKARNGQAYVDKILKTSKRNDRIKLSAFLAASLAATAGLAYIQAKYDF